MSQRDSRKELRAQALAPIKSKGEDVISMLWEAFCQASDKLKGAKSTSFGKAYLRPTELL